MTTTTGRGSTAAWAAKWAWVFLAMPLAVGPAACSRADDPAPPQSTSAAAAADSVSGPAAVTGQAPVGAIVALEPVGAELAMPDGPVVMDQFSRQFIPDLLIARVGQVVEFRNSEDVDHNIRVIRQPTGTVVFNESGSQGQVFRHTFEQPGSYEVSCDIHPGMRAMIVAARTPHVAIADPTGRFTVSSVPAGRYTLRVTSEGRDTTREVAVASPHTDIPGASR
jgi:plastocyanin